MGKFRLPTGLSTLSTRKLSPKQSYPQENNCYILIIKGKVYIRSTWCLVLKGVGFMKLIFAGKNMDITQALKDITSEKMSKLDKYFDEDIEGHVTYSTEGDRHKIEVTINLPGTILRAEEETYDMYESLDKVVDILEGQIRKYKGKLQARYRNTDTIRFENIKPLEEEEEDNGPKIVRTKRFILKPMTPEEAVLQMELLNHDFFVYMDGDTGETNVVYKRKDGNYGVIEPEF